MKMHGKMMMTSELEATDVLSAKNLFAGYGQCERDVEREKKTGYCHGTVFWRKYGYETVLENCRQKRCLRLGGPGLD